MRITKNSFAKGLNADIDPQSLPPDSYVDAHNLTLTSDGKFLALKNFQGTLPTGAVTGGINTLFPDSTNVRSIVGKYKVGDVEGVNFITYFITGNEAGDQGAFYITAYDLDNDVLYYLFQQQGLGTDYFDEHRIVDLRSFAENGIDYIYFTDFFNEIRQLRCEIPAGSPDFFLTEQDLSLQRHGANGVITYNNSTVVDGTLLSGTYQYAYRMVDPIHKRSTRWSSLTSPIHVYQQANTFGVTPVYSAVGISTPFGITITITPTAEESALFSYYQLAVVENIYPVTTPVTPASLLPITAVTNTPFAGSSVFIHRSNDKIGTVPIEEIVVDLAAIQTAKTLAIKQERLFAGNIKYHKLDFDNGTPATSGSVLTSHAFVSNHLGGFNDARLSSLDRGYFRDETYRFGIVYRDKYGNKAPVSVLDLSTLTGNQISGGAIDFHFPSRAVSNQYSLFDGSGFVRLMGLNLTNIHNHPTWAVGFEIVVARRIKNILFQTPLISLVGVNGVGTLDNYPSLSVNVADGIADNPYPNAQPQTNSKIYVPRNLFWPESRSIKSRTTAIGGTGTTVKIGEAVLTPTNDGNPASTTSTIAENYLYSMIFPPSSMYGAAIPYQFVGNEQIQTVDYAIAKLNVANFNPNMVDSFGGSIGAGDSVKTKISGTFYALSDGDYYFDSGWSAKTIPLTKIGIKDYLFLDNLAPGTVFGGNRILDHEALAGVGVDYGATPQVQRGAIIGLAISKPEINTIGPLVFANGTLNDYTLSANYIVGSSGPRYEEANVGISGQFLITNKYISEYSGFVNNSSYVQYFEIVNVVNNFGDDRYGTIDTPHEFISTGTSYAFNETELALVAAGSVVNISTSVFGGDCFVAPHTFKIADSAYSVVFQGKNEIPAIIDSSSITITKWGRFYYNHPPGGVTGAPISLPVGVQGASQFIEVVLESEYNGGVMAEDIINGVAVANGFPVMNLSTTQNSEGAIHSPLLYDYNNNLSKQDDQKIYFTRQPFNFIQYNFKSRINYSDLKIYGSDIQGFDIFRIGNTFDLEENKGAITKLAVEGDNMYGIQETGVVYLPTGQVQLQQTDAGQLAVGTGDVIARPIIINQASGSQHMNAIVETGDAIYIPNVANKDIYKLQGRNLEPIDNLNFNTKTRQLFAETIPEDKLVGIYDQDRGEYWLADNENNFCYIFCEDIGELGTWVGNYEFFDPLDALTSKLVAGAYGNQRLYLVADTTTGGRTVLTGHAMYRGAENNMFGRVVQPRVTVVVNPDSDVSKTFDVMSFAATDRLASMDLTVQREASLGDQVVNNISLDNLSIEGNYRVKTLRDSSSARLRGLRMLATIKWKQVLSQTAALSSVLVKYRWSARNPF